RLAGVLGRERAAASGVQAHPAPAAGLEGQIAFGLAWIAEIGRPAAAMVDDREHGVARAWVGVERPADEVLECADAARIPLRAGQHGRRANRLQALRSRVAHVDTRVAGLIAVVECYYAHVAIVESGEPPSELIDWLA